jgi:hypothetical protein
VAVGYSLISINFVTLTNSGAGTAAGSGLPTFIGVPLHLGMVAFKFYFGRTRCVTSGVGRG